MVSVENAEWSIGPSSLKQAPVIRGALTDCLPSDLRELCDWLNAKLRDNERPHCPTCLTRCMVAYIADQHCIWWGCHKCHRPYRTADFDRLAKYAKRRLGHKPRDCFG